MPLVPKVKSVPKALLACLGPSAIPALPVSAVLLVCPALQVSQVLWDTTASLVLKAYEASRALKAPADSRDPQAEMECLDLPAKTVPSALPVFPAATVSLVHKDSQVSQALRALQALPDHPERPLLPPFQRCPLAPASSMAWCALLSTANLSPAPPCPSPGTAS